MTHVIVKIKKSVALLLLAGPFTCFSSENTAIDIGGNFEKNDFTTESGLKTAKEKTISLQEVYQYE